MKSLLKKLAGKQVMSAYHATKSNAARMIYGNPSRDLIVIGITGTNGKTTTAHLVASIFEHAGFKVALISTIQFRIGKKTWVNESKMTVPAPGAFNRFLKQAREQGCQVLVMEATSIALDQSRMAGLRFDTAVLTNITHDHLDYHGTFADYVQAKRNLFARDLRVSVLNDDDPNGRTFADLVADMHYFYSLDPHNTGAFRPERIEQIGDKLRITCAFPHEGMLELETALVGDFNVANILAAVAVGFGHGIGESAIKSGIAAVKAVPGRMEKVEDGQPFTVIIDYAHTPDALEKLFSALKPFKKGRIISVFGATGDRDKTKRPIMGKIVGQHADVVIVTNEDPWTEDAQFIIDSVAAGVPESGRHIEGQTFWRILDRREAIRQAFELAGPGDIVTITGKGAETGMGIGKNIIPWSDRQVAGEELKRLTHD